MHYFELNQSVHGIYGASMNIFDISTTVSHAVTLVQPVNISDDAEFGSRSEMTSHIADT